MVKEKKLVKFKKSFETQSVTHIIEALTVKANKIHWLPSVLEVNIHNLSLAIIELNM